MGEAAKKPNAGAPDEPFASGSHHALFEPEPIGCGVCGVAIESDADDDLSHAVQGRGLLMWTRGDERRFEEPTLCADCAQLIGLSALRQWEIEEEEEG